MTIKFSSRTDPSVDTFHSTIDSQHQRPEPKRPEEYRKAEGVV